MMTNENKPTPSPANQSQYDLAVKKGLGTIADGGSKADAARAIFELIRDESREVVIQAFIEGATVTEKGAPTYYYNINRQFQKSHNRASKNSRKANSVKES